MIIALNDSRARAALCVCLCLVSWGCSIAIVANDVDDDYSATHDEISRRTYTPLLPLKKYLACICSLCCYLSQPSPAVCPSSLWKARPAHRRRCVAL